jgi:hypothetical protein
LEQLEQQPPHSHVPVDDTPSDRLSAPALEKLAEYATREQSRVLNRQAGDIYLAELKDPSAALRCYRRVLDSATLDELNISDSDNWFIKALKEARLKEIQGENKNG